MAKSAPLFDQIAAAVKEDGKTLVGKVNGVIQVRPHRGHTEAVFCLRSTSPVPVIFGIFSSLFATMGLIYHMNNVIYTS